MPHVPLGQVSSSELEARRTFEFSWPGGNQSTFPAAGQCLSCGSLDTALRFRCLLCVLCVRLLCVPCVLCVLCLLGLPACLPAGLPACLFAPIPIESVALQSKCTRNRRQLVSLSVSHPYHPSVFQALGWFGAVFRVGSQGDSVPDNSGLFGESTCFCFLLSRHGARKCNSPGKSKSISTCLYDPLGSLPSGWDSSPPRGCAAWPRRWTWRVSRTRELQAKRRARMARMASPAIRWSGWVSEFKG